MELSSLTTKERILDAAIVLFSDRGYDKVSMRDIAGTVGIKASSIYNHFPSKRDILESIYAFYSHERELVFPDLESILPLVETEPIKDVLLKLHYYWPVSLQDRMDRILLIASQRIYLDKDSEDFVRENFFNPIVGVWIETLNRAMELGRIEPIDINCFVRLLTYYAFSTAELNRTTMKVTLEQWRNSFDMFFSLLKPVGD